MKRIITLTFVFMMVFSLFISCNDGEEGLFQMAANSVKKESFKILNIINKESDNVYIVATDNGIAKYDTETKSFSNFIGNGVMATNAVWASSDGNHFIYYDTESKAYLNEDGNEETIINLNNKIPQPLYSVNGKEFTYVFKDEDNKFYSLYTSSALDKSQFLAIDPVEVVIDEKIVNSVTIIGNGILRVITTDKEAYFYDSISPSSPSSPSVKPYKLIDTTLPQGISDSYLFITVDGKIYRFNNNSDSTEIAKTDSSIAKRPAIFEKNEYTYFIPEGSSSIFELKDEGSKVTKSTKTVTGLQNITVIAIIDKIDTNKLLVLTANNGLQELEMK